MVACQTPGGLAEKGPRHRQTRPRNHRSPPKWAAPIPDANARLAAAVEKARKESVSRDVIERAIKKGAGIGGEKLVMEHVVFEGYAPHKVPVIVEVYTDNVNRTAPEIRMLFRKGQLGTAGSNKFLFDHAGLVEAHHPDADIDLEAAAIEAGANEVEPLTREQNDDIPEGAAGARFICRPRRGARGLAMAFARTAGRWSPAKSAMCQRAFPNSLRPSAPRSANSCRPLEDHDDVHRVWAAVK